MTPPKKYQAEYNYIVKLGLETEDGQYKYKMSEISDRLGLDKEYIKYVLKQIRKDIPNFRPIMGNVENLKRYREDKLVEKIKYIKLQVYAKDKTIFDLYERIAKTKQWFDYYDIEFHCGKCKFASYSLTDLIGHSKECFQ